MISRVMIGVMRGARGGSRRREPALPKVQKIEVSEKNIKLRAVLVAVFVVIGVIALTVFVATLLRKEDGWREIETTSAVAGLSDEFVLQYDLGSTASATAEYRSISQLYTKTGSHLYALFDRYEEKEGVVNLYTISHSPNETLQIDPVLYDAFAAMEASGMRYLYLAPVYAEYESLFHCENDIYAANRDPKRSESAREYIAALMRYCVDETMINLELLGDDRVCLRVSEEYLTFAEEYELDALIDFSWLKNAFIIDALADALASAGYTVGNLSSYDGYMRNLDTTGNEYTYNYFDRYQNGIYHAATLQYRGDLAVVDLRTYALRQQDTMRMYAYADGVYATLYVDPADGYYRNALHGLLAYSDTNGCAEIALSVAPAFIAEQLDQTLLSQVTEQDIYALWTVDGLISNNGPDLTVNESSLHSSETITYRTITVGD
ncbi:MAG: hypothetical protein IJW40_01965 [Clostridia bacterium]|nr:hypothetical protein [Clostridia bacterium]